MPLIALGRLTLACAIALTVAFAAPPASNVDWPDGLYAKFEMPHGNLVARLFYEQTPLTVTSFVGLAEGTLAPRAGRPFFTGLRWYRVVPNFVIQSGDPNFSPDRNDEEDSGPFRFPDEFAPGLHHDAAGILSMANGGPDTNGCEFFITLRDTTRLNYLHSVFGRVVQGLDVLPKISPDEPIRSISILRIGAAAKAFRADEAAFTALRHRAKTYAANAESGPAAHFDDPDHLLPTEPPRARNFNFKLANFERATGTKIVARVFAKLPVEAQGQTKSEFGQALGEQLHVGATGAVAAYFADTAEWELWAGSAAESRLEPRAKLLAATAAETVRFIAEAEAAAKPGAPVSAAQKTKYAVDAMLDALILRLEPAVPSSQPESQHRP